LQRVPIETYKSYIWYSININRTGGHLSAKVLFFFFFWFVSELHRRPIRINTTHPQTHCAKYLNSSTVTGNQLLLLLLLLILICLSKTQRPTTPCSPASYASIGEINYRVKKKSYLDSLFLLFCYFHTLTEWSWLAEATIPVTGDCASAAIRPSWACTVRLWFFTMFHTPRDCMIRILVRKLPKTC